MNELLQAAKAVISAWDDQYRSIDMRLKNLRAAVERAEKQEAVGFKEWMRSINNMTEPFFNSEDAAERAWTAAQQAERERCREIVITMGGPDVPDLLRQIDSGEQ